MEFLKVNIFKEKEGEREREEKYYKKKQQYFFFPFLFFLKNLVWDSVKAKPQRIAGEGCGVSEERARATRTTLGRVFSYLPSFHCTWRNDSCAQFLKQNYISIFILKKKSIMIVPEPLEMGKGQDPLTCVQD